MELACSSCDLGTSSQHYRAGGWQKELCHAPRALDKEELRLALQGIWGQALALSCFLIQQSGPL